MQPSPSRLLTQPVRSPVTGSRTTSKSVGSAASALFKRPPKPWMLSYTPMPSVLRLLGDQVKLP